MGVSFELLLVETPEQALPSETPEQFSVRVTQEKLDEAWNTVLHDKLPSLPILCADTEVVLDEEILGKPMNKEDAFHMLKRLSGRTHRVITSVGVKYGEYQHLILNTTFVTFASIPDEAIQHYLSIGDFLDKSGSYGIQSYIGQFISRIEGCFYSVMGLPLNTVRELLEEVRLLYK